MKIREIALDLLSIYVQHSLKDCGKKKGGGVGGFQQ